MPYGQEPGSAGETSNLESRPQPTDDTANGRVGHGAEDRSQMYGRRSGPVEGSAQEHRSRSRHAAPNSSLGQTTIAIGQAATAIGQTTIGIGQTTIGIGQTTIGIGQTTIGIGQTTIGLGQQGIGPGQPNGIGQTTVGIGEQRSNLGQPGGIGRTTIGIGSRPEPSHHQRRGK